jgi:hypothetical protein
MVCKHVHIKKISYPDLITPTMITAHLVHNVRNLGPEAANAAGPGLADHLRRLHSRENTYFRSKTKSFS